MKYIIDEKELNNVLNFHIPYFGTNTVSEIHKLVTTFLADKQQVVEVASGIVSEINLDSCIVGKENDYVKFDDLFRYLQGKNIKIYISKE